MEEKLASLAQGEYKKQMDLLTSIKGIGVTLATALIVATGGFTYFDNAKQLTRYLGACHLLTNNPARQSMSKVTSTETGIQTLEASSMWRLSLLSGLIPSVRPVSTVYGLTASPVRWRSLRSPTNS